MRLQTKTPDLNTSLFVGIDIHSLEHTALAINRFEEEIGSISFTNSRKGISQFFSWLTKTQNRNSTFTDAIIGVEGSGGYGRLLSSYLVANYQHVYEVNPLYTKQRREFGTRRDKSDRKDAKLIAEVLTKKLSQLPKIKKREDSEILHTLRELVRYYDDLVHQRTKLKNQIYFLLRQQGVLDGKLSFSQRRIKSWQAKLKRIKSKKDTAWEKAAMFMVAQKLSQITRLNGLIDETKEELRKLFVKTKYENLISIDGVNIILAAKIAAESQGIERFANINKFIAYAGLSPKEASSGKSRRHKKQKQGNRKLNSAFHLLALSQLRLSPTAREYFDKKVKEGKSKKYALRCLAKRSACIVYGMMRSGEPYRG